MSEAIERELRHIRARAGAPRERRLGCSTVSHDRLGFCNGCDPNRTEILGWRLLALREAAPPRPHIANRNEAGFSCSCGFSDPADCPVETAANQRNFGGAS